MHSIKGCQIRAMEFGDLERVLAWRNHPDVSRYMLSQHDISRDEHRHWFELASRDPTRRLLIVEDGESALGFVHFSGVASGAIADWGFYAAPDAPKGAGKMLGITAVDFAFQSLELHKICGRALGFNEASIRLHSALGFQQEGVLRDQHRIGSTYHDLICYGLLSHEWPGKESR